MVTVFLASLLACDTSTLRIERRGEGSARVTSDPPGLDCELGDEGSCEGALPTGATVTLNVRPGSRTTFLAWEGCSAPERCVLTMREDRTVTLVLDHERPIRLSDTDRDPSVVLSEDGLRADFGVAQGAVRSEGSVQPGAGAFYFEVRRLIPQLGAYGFGVATGEAPLSGASVGADGESFGLFVDGTLYHGGARLGRIDPPNEVFGLVVDYRGGAPVVHVIARDERGDPRVAHSQSLDAIDAPLYVYLAGSKHAPRWHLALNPGNDTANAPFAYDARAVLTEAGLAALADSLTLGWGSTFRGAPDEPPAITVEADREVARGDAVTVRATARDPEDGDLSSRIEWELLSSPHYAGRVRGEGASFTFTPTAVGLHPAVARVRDALGHVAEATVRVRVRGPVERVDRVRLVRDEASGPGVELRGDGLAARWTADGKNGVRANQSLYGELWYFEIQRLVEPINQGGGVVIGEGNLGPYTLADVPPSCSINTVDGVYRDLIWHSDFPAAPASYEHYGFAVDYRGEHPIVYVIAGDAVIDELVLDDVWTEIYPMLYGNPTYRTERGAFDEAINFGRRPFAYDVASVLDAHGVDTRELVVGWGPG